MLDVFTLPVVASICILATLAVSRGRLGPTADWVETMQTIALPALDPLIERHLGGVGSQYQLDEREYVVHLEASPELVECWLWIEAVDATSSPLERRSGTTVPRSARGRTVATSFSLETDRST